MGAPWQPDLLPDGLSTVSPPRPVSAGLVSDVLLRRPDILAAEHQLRAANANIGAARAAYFPRIALTVGVGSAEQGTSALLGCGHRHVELRPADRAADLQCRRDQKAKVKVSQVDRDIAVARYEKGDSAGLRRSLERTDAAPDAREPAGSPGGAREVARRDVPALSTHATRRVSTDISACSSRSGALHGAAGVGGRAAGRAGQPRHALQGPRRRRLKLGRVVASGFSRTSPRRSDALEQVASLRQHADLGVGDARASASRIRNPDGCSAPGPRPGCLGADSIRRARHLVRDSATVDLMSTTPRPKPIRGSRSRKTCSSSAGRCALFEHHVIGVQGVPECLMRFAHVPCLDGLTAVVAEAQVHGGHRRDRVEHAVDRRRRPLPLVGVPGQIGFVLSLA